MIAMVLVLSARGAEVETEPAPVSDQARRATTVGAIEVGVGSAAILGGLGLMLVGRGPPGEVSDESNAVHDGRTIGGAVLVLGGLTSVALGIDSLSRGARLREQESGGATARLSPLFVPGGGGVTFDLTFQ
jgi:hypothetical protein